MTERNEFVTFQVDKEEEEEVVEVVVQAKVNLPPSLRRSLGLEV